MASPSSSLLFLSDLRAQYGDVAQYETAFGQVHFFNRPEHIAAVLDHDALQRTELVTLVLGKGLLSSDGAYWRKQRKLMQPEFTRLRSEEFAGLVTHSTQELLRTWDPLLGTGESVDIAPAMTELTLEVIVAALFSVELKREGPGLASAQHNVCLTVGPDVEVRVGRVVRTLAAAADPCPVAAGKETLELD